MKKKCTFLACLFSVLGAYAWDGEGTQTTPYLLSSAQDIVELGEYYDTGNHEPAWFVMTQDIDMKGIIMSPVSGVFNGFIDGQNHEITNLVIVTENGGAALFSEIRDGSIRNLTIASGYIESNGSAAALALTMNNSQMTNCINNATVISNGRYANNVGGLVATGVSSVIRNCVNRGLVMATGENSSNVGGIVGSTNGTETIDLCANYGTVSGTETIGGIVGALGSNDELYNSYNMGFVSGATTVGGVVGTQSTPLIAENDGSYVYMCWNGGQVSGDKLVGGIGGQTKSIRYCKNVGIVGDMALDSGESVGGINGNGDVVYSCNTGDVYGTAGVGGISGNVASVESCFNRGNVYGLSQIGGIGGRLNGTACDISNCYNSSEVHCEDKASSGAVTGYIYFGGFINSNYVKATYWNTDLEELGYPDESDDVQITGLNGAELSALSLPGFVADTDGENNGFPLIAGMEFGEEPQVAVISRLTVNGSENGQIYPVGEIKSAVGSSLSFRLQPDAEYCVSDILVDGESVMSQIEFTETIDESHDFVYTFEPTAENHVVDVRFSVFTGISSSEDTPLKVWFDDGAVCIDGESGIPYAVYTIEGLMLEEGKTENGTMRIAIPEGLHIVLVKAGAHTFKFVE